MTRYVSVATAFFCLLCATSIASAQNTSQPITNDATNAQRIDEVIVKSPKNAAVMPYDGMYERLKRFQDSKLDRVKIEVRVTPADQSIQESEIRVALVNDAQSVPLKIAADGLIELPVRADFYKTEAEFRANQPKGKLRVSLGVSTTWSPPGHEVEYAEIEECMRQVEVAAKDVAGWLVYTLFFPSFERLDLRIRYPRANSQTLDIVNDGRVIKTFKADDKGVLTFRLDRRWREWQPKFVFSEIPPKI